MKRFLLATLFIGMLGATANAQRNSKTLPDEEIKAVIAKCKMTLIHSDFPRQSKLPVTSKREKYKNVPVVAYAVSEEGRVQNIRLRKSSGVRWIDEFAIQWAESFTYKPMPGCPGVETEMGVIIDFNGN